MRLNFEITENTINQFRGLKSDVVEVVVLLVIIQCLADDVLYLIGIFADDLGGSCGINSTFFKQLVITFDGGDWVTNLM